ncbi:hypothetical protein B4U79_09804 [Dinothrombium tinctorium]|uniref:Uncharacterized protein n=1 Tax=Dinothrombium tinctorium TaxID=1965070 RepID=A0A443R634_9ACAR|nr:hypothetical protein B4U79_09804 [Dinothrombium tinctorium]
MLSSYSQGERGREYVKNILTYQSRR